MNKVIGYIELVNIMSFNWAEFKRMEEGPKQALELRQLYIGNWKTKLETKQETNQERNGNE